MTLKIIGYDLHGPDKDYPTLIDAIKAYPHEHLQQSVWAIQTSRSAKAVGDELERLIDRDDKLFVAQVSDFATVDKTHTVCAALQTLAGDQQRYFTSGGKTVLVD